MYTRPNLSEFQSHTKHQSTLPKITKLSDQLHFVMEKCKMFDQVDVDIQENLSARPNIF